MSLHQMLADDVNGYLRFATARWSANNRVLSAELFEANLAIAIVTNLIACVTNSFW